jgi:hypothetical protein
MDDPRVELSTLTGGGDPTPILRALDSVELVVEAPPERTRSREDQVALYNLVSSAARLFPHLTLALEPGVRCELAAFVAGDLRDELRGLQADLAPTPTAEPAHRFHVAWGMTPTGAGLAGDASGWTYSVGPARRPLARRGGPALGAIAASSFLVAQTFGRVLVAAGVNLPFHPTSGFIANLLDYRLTEAPEVDADCGMRLGPLALLGAGSIGSSAIYAALLSAVAGGPVELVDPDAFRERNKLRYPILRTLVTDAKVTWLAELARESGLELVPHEKDVQGFLEQFADPPAIALAAVSVDTPEGRRDATDVLALTTLNSGVGGMQLHVARHGFGDGACAYCQYVDERPSLSGSQMLANMIGLSVDRVIAIHQLDGGVVSEIDVAQMAASGLFRGEPPRAGERLADLQRRIYAQAAVQTDGGQVLISTPFVSAMAGLLLLVEGLKESDERLHPFRLGGRYDLDMSGEPPPFTQATARDTSGRCLCHSPFRRTAYRRLHGLGNGTRQTRVRDVER